MNNEVLESLARIETKLNELEERLDNMVCKHKTEDMSYSRYGSGECLNCGKIFPTPYQLLSHAQMLNEKK